jgi:hypothetical protein
MRVKIIALLVTLLASCTIAPGSPEDHSVVTYYDRNRDGIADYELHQVRNTTYLSFVLIDSKFTGRYDLRMSLAYPYNNERVNLPVPRRVKVIPGMPPYPVDKRFNPPMPGQ